MIIPTIVAGSIQIKLGNTNSVRACFFSCSRTYTASTGAVVPVAYPILADGPVGELLIKLGRHNMRPSHLHLKVTAEGYKPLVTQIYPKGDIWLTSDSAFGVKPSLVVVCSRFLVEGSAWLIASRASQ
jgi:protocatechuate 3,4-dioxygenase beta subunit